MQTEDFKALLPFIILMSSIVIIMLTIAFRRGHRLAWFMTLAGMGAALATLPSVWKNAPQQVTRLVVLDTYGLFFISLICLTGIAVAGLSYTYARMRKGMDEEYYLLLLSSVLGACVLAVSTHFASFFLGLEILSVSLYALTAYDRHSEPGIEAGVKYLILAAVASAFILFGMALLYAGSGTLELKAELLPASVDPLFLAGLVMIITGVGFKLAVVPFHLWTPDVYQGAPAPVTAFIATASKAAVFALLLRLVVRLDFAPDHGIFLLLSVIAVASMFTGNVLALLQKNVKRMLAYSSIAHMGYLLVTLLATGSLGAGAASFYLAAYIPTTLCAFGTMTILSGKDRDADRHEDYAGLAWKHPWLAAVFTIALFSLAGIPLTAGFIGKFYIVAAGVGTGLWFLIIMLLINSALSMFYYLRLIAVLFEPAAHTAPREAAISRSGGSVLLFLGLALVWIGMYPGPLIAFVHLAVQNLK